MDVGLRSVDGVIEGRRGAARTGADSRLISQTPRLCVARRSGTAGGGGEGRPRRPRSRGRRAEASRSSLFDQKMIVKDETSCEGVPAAGTLRGRLRPKRSERFCQRTHSISIE